MNRRANRVIASSVLVLGIPYLSPPCRADDLNGLKSCVTAAGDLDRDGTPDFAVASRDGILPEVVWLLSGKDGSILRVLHGREPGDGFGCALAAAGDLDGDGVPDLLIAANGGPDPDFWPNTSPWIQTGPVVPKSGPAEWSRFRRQSNAYVRLLSGRSGSVIHEFDAGKVDGLVGLSVAAAPDVNGDGFTDVLFGSPRLHGTGIVEVRSGRDGSRIHRIEGTRILVEPLATQGCADGFGAAVAGLSDVDGDGFGDFVVGAPKATLTDGKSNPTGCVILFSGKEAKPRYVTYGGREDTQLGWSLARIADVDGDGTSEVLAGGLNRCVQLLRGANLESIRTFASRGGYGYSDSFASSLDSLGDIDGDGLPEFLVGAREGLSLEAFDEGYAQVFAIRSSSPVRTDHLSEFEGVDVCGLGDVDGDSVPDIVLASRQACASPGSLSSMNRRGRTAPVNAKHGTLRIRSGKNGVLLREIDLGELRDLAEHDARRQR